MTERQDKRLAKRIAAAEQDGERRAADLERRLSEVEAEVTRTRDVASENWNAIREARSEMGEVRQEVERLVSEVLGGFESLSASLQAMEQKSQDASRDIVAGIRSSEETSRAGLRHLSTGFAMADALKVGVEADEIELEMAEALKDLDDRRQAAERGIEEKRAAYDKAVSTIYDGLEEELGSLGAHILDLQESLVRILDELRPSEAEIRGRDRELLLAQRGALEDRGRSILGPLQELDTEALSRLVTLRESLDAFLEQHTVQDLVPEGTGDSVLPGLGVPIIAVSAPESEYNEAGGRMDVYGPGCEVGDCAEGARPAVVPAELAVRLGRMCAGLSASVDGAAPLGRQDIAELKAAISRLADQGLLTSEDALMVQAHLDAHPLYRLES